MGKFAGIAAERRWPAAKLALTENMPFFFGQTAPRCFDFAEARHFANASGRDQLKNFHSGVLAARGRLLAQIGAKLLFIGCA